MLKLLLSQFIKSNGRKPNNLEMILLRQKASKEAVNERKIVNMFDRQPVDANKPILGGKNIIETDEQMIQRFKNQNKEAVERLKNKKEPEDMAGGGVAGLLGERPRQNFAMGKRAFLKLMGGVGAGIAGLKSGLLGFGKKEAAKKAITETVKQSAGSGTPPPYFFKLVEKIKTLGDETVATKDKTNAYKYKDYTMEEDFAGNIEIIKKGIRDEPDTPEVFMSLKVDEVPLKGKKGSTKVEEYEEFTGKRDYKGDLDVEPGVPDNVLKEIEAGSGNVPESFYTGPNPIKKADGGRIGYSVGSKVIGKGIMAGINKLFGKGTMTTADKIKRPQKALDREMFKKTDKRLNDKRQMTDDEYQDFADEIGDNIEAYDFDGTVGDAKRIIKDIKDYEAEMFAEYKSIGGSKRLGGPKDPMADAIDNASPGYTGDLKYDAQLVADDLAEKMFKVEYDDLTQAQQMDLYDKAYTALSKNQQGFKQMQKLSKPTNTLESIKNTGKIDISNPNVADEFTKFMKESNPKGFKDIEQKIQLESFDPKKTKGNADGGRIGLSTGGLAAMLGE